MSRFLLVCVALLAALWSNDAAARRVPLDAQIRAHAGLGLADGGFTPGGTAGLDTRLSRILYMDVGGFLSAVPPVTEAAYDPADPASTFALRHGIYVTPGFRVPHRYGEGFNWDLVGRVGFGVVWANDAAAERAPLVTDPAALGGADLLLRYNKVGLRIAGKAFYWNSFSAPAREEVAMVRPHVAVEGVFQW